MSNQETNEKSLSPGNYVSVQSYCLAISFLNLVIILCSWWGSVHNVTKAGPEERNKKDEF